MWGHSLTHTIFITRNNKTYSSERRIKSPNSHVGWFFYFPRRVFACLEIRLLVPTKSFDEPLHWKVPDTRPSSKSSTSSDMMKCCGVALPPMKLESTLSDEAREGRPGLVTMVKPVSISICCQRCSLSLKAAVTSPRACLENRSVEKKGWNLHLSPQINLYDTYWT